MTTDSEELRRIFTSASLGVTAYRTWALRARRERRFNVARLLEALAAAKAARAEHAFLQLNEVGSTARNVEHALRGLEPESIATGPVTGKNPLARDLLERAQTALKENRDLYANEIGNLYVCSHCGYIREGELASACPACGTVPEAHRSFKAIEAMGTLGPYAIMAFLDRSEAALRKLVEGLDDELLGQRLDAERPSLKELTCHLTAIDAVFRERAWLLLETDHPELSPSHPPRLTDTASACSASVSTVLDAFHQSRRQTLSLLRGLTSAAWHRTGHHEIYGEVDLLHQSNWMVNHERTHLVEMAQLRHDLLAADSTHHEAAELAEVVVSDVSEGE